MCPRVVDGSEELLEGPDVECELDPHLGKIFGDRPRLLGIDADIQDERPNVSSCRRIAPTIARQIV